MYRIIRAWVLTLTGRNKKLAKERFNICIKCPSVRANAFFYYCGECGCPLAAKNGKAVGKTYDYNESCTHPESSKW